MRRLHAAALLFAMAFAPAQAQDTWTGSDKRLHFAGSAFVGLAAAAVTDSNGEAFAGCAAVGLAKELATWRALDVKPSGRDMVWNLLGCSAGIGLARVAIRHEQGRTTVSFAAAF